MSKFEQGRRSRYDSTEYVEEDRPVQNVQNGHKPKAARGTAEYAQIKIKRDVHNAIKSLSSVTNEPVQELIESILREGIIRRFKEIDLSKIITW